MQIIDFFFFSQLFILVQLGRNSKFLLWLFGCLSVLIYNYSAITILSCQETLSLAALKVYPG